MSLQDLGPPNIPVYSYVIGWPKLLFNEIGLALKRGVTFKVVLSNQGAAYGTGYDWDNATTLNTLYSSLFDSFDDTAELRTRLCKQFGLATLRYSSDSEYPTGFIDESGKDTGKKGIANHTKAILVDQKAFYIGSQNLYQNDLAEFGYIIEDPTSASSFEKSYWSPLWTYSSPTRISGFGEQELGFKDCLDRLQGKR